MARPISNQIIHEFSQALHEVGHQTDLTYFSYTELVGYWNKYVGTWGGKAKTFKFKGYINNQLVKEIEAGPSTSFDLLVQPSKLELINENTYDTLRIRLQHVDNHNNVLEYSSRPVEISVSGPIELIGPSIQTLVGGQLSLFIKSIGKSGNASVTIKMDEIIKTITFIVK